MQAHGHDHALLTPPQQHPTEVRAGPRRALIEGALRPVVDDPELVITMGCGDAGPIYRGKRYEDWELDDPAGQPGGTVVELPR